VQKLPLVKLHIDVQYSNLSDRSGESPQLSDSDSGSGSGSGSGSDSDNNVFPDSRYILQKIDG
jgi:hypothetical protein